MILTYKPIHETLKGCYHIYSNKEIQPIGSFEVDNNKVICRLSKSAKIFIGTYETIEEAWIEIEKIVQAKYEQPSYYFFPRVRSRRYSCNCSYCLSNKTASDRRREMSANYQIKQIC